MLQNLLDITLCLCGIIIALLMIVTDLAFNVHDLSKVIDNLQQGIDAAIASTVNGTFDPTSTETPPED
jgi:uncharacterized protein YoxC